ncbi:uncharacterized protein A1O5_11374 [Cladophialophora psammophila CBS 110553]|uniref:MmgE/PrpD N-terminal domain-containing protein n=1 Tax=Cladophialophora psammophila CBS 110553 TaxID=1182543 RepID=W9W6M2_9EURO|nr:uncharacterized protein A1O5_11374 [Cladophialophora psammophila CBS 110553]EXJ63613.1 hypothetical protein A1O5_11374 [Cladophialophora psammophila CBS 110553]
MNTTGVNYTAELASFAANATFSAIPSSFLALLPISILDTFSTMLAGSVQPVYRSAIKAVDITYGTGSTHAAYTALDGTVSSLSGQMFLLGLAAADFEFEHVIQNAHPASAMFPALLCVAAAHHKAGKELLAAMAVGYELATRIGAASTAHVESVRGFHNPGLNGDLATAAAVGRLMGWDADTIASAMGLAASSSGGLLAFVNTGAMTKRLHAARAGQLGAEAAFLAHARVVGPANVLENPLGFFHAFSPGPQPSLLTAGLGANWTGEQMILKLAPVHARAQGFVFAINDYRTRTNQSWSAGAIKNVTIYAGPAVLASSNWIPQPNSLVSAQYSVPFGIAAALTVDLRDPLNMNDALVSNTTAQSIAAGMKHVQITDNAEDLAGYMTLEIQGQEINITANKYPGIPGDPGYAQAAKNKFASVTQGLSVSAQGAAVEKKIADVSNLTDASVLLEEMVEVGTAAAANFGSSTDTILGTLKAYHAGQARSRVLP